MSGGRRQGLRDNTQVKKSLFKKPELLNNSERPRLLGFDRQRPPEKPYLANRRVLEENIPRARRTKAKIYVVPFWSLKNDLSINLATILDFTMRHPCLISMSILIVLSNIWWDQWQE